VGTVTEPIQLKTVVHHSLANRPILEFLCTRFRYLPRETWIKRLATGRILLNGRVPTADEVVHRGDVVEYTIDVIEPKVDFSYEVLHSDDDILVVSKSGNIPVHASGRYIRNTLIARLRNDTDQKVALAHRIDRETSGIVVLTRNRRAARALGDAFARGLVDKTYVGVVRGDPAWTALQIDTPLGRIGKLHPVPRSVVDRKTGKSAVTRVAVVERFGPATLVEARPLTGRTHQIRAHLESVGHPIVGDKIYGVPAALLREITEHPSSVRSRAHLALPRHALHHARVAFPRPGTGARIAIECPLPSDIRAFIDRAAR